MPKLDKKAAASMLREVILSDCGTYPGHMVILKLEIHLMQQGCLSGELNVMDLEAVRQVIAVR